MKKTTIVLGIILLFSCFLRFWDLGTKPYGLSNDEVNYLYSSYTVWKTGGHDLQGRFLPLSINVDSSLSPIPVYLVSPIVGIFGPSVFTGRFLYALFSVGVVFLTYLLAKLLLKNTTIAILSAGVMSFMPWSVVMGRSAWDVSIAIFFYMLGLVLFIRAIEKGNIIWSLIPFALAFYSYHGMKIFFIALLPLLLFFYRNALKNRKKEIIGFVLGLILIIVSFLLVLKTQGVTRQDVIIFNSLEYQKNVTQEIKFQRTNSDAPQILRSVFSNKVLVYLNILIDQYLGAFSPSHIFTAGDVHRINGYGIFMKGIMYTINLPFLVFGCFYLLQFDKKNKKHLILLLLLLAPLPSTIGAGKSYIYRSFMMTPFLEIIVACGMYFLWNFFKRNQLLRICLLLFAIGIYFFSISNFLYQYFYQFTVYGGEFSYQSSRTLSEYIGKNHTKFDRVWIVDVPDLYLLDYGYYNKIDPHLVQKVWGKKTGKKLGNVELVYACYHGGVDDPQKVLPPRTMTAVPKDCYKSNPSLTIHDTLVGGDIIWKVYEKN